MKSDRGTLRLPAGVKKEPDGRIRNPRIGIAVSRYHSEITGRLLASCVETLRKGGIPPARIHVAWAPGSFELPLVCRRLLTRGRCHAAIALGCLIRGQTPHFHYIAGAVADSLQRIAEKIGRPAIFGVITALNRRQAIARSGGSAGGRGREAAEACLAMLGHG